MCVVEMSVEVSFGEYVCGDDVDEWFGKVVGDWANNGFEVAEVVDIEDKSVGVVLSLGTGFACLAIEVGCSLV